MEMISMYVRMKNPIMGKTTLGGQRFSRVYLGVILQESVGYARRQDKKSFWQKSKP